MNKLMLSAAVVGAIACLGLSASAQSYGRRGQPMATLYEGYNFEGRSIDVYGDEENLSGLRFNDKARSARFQGQWRVCEDAGFGGRCQDVRGDVPDLNRIGMAERISSLQAYGAGGYGGGYNGGYNGGYSGGRPGGQSRPAEGARSVFFAYPNLGGVTSRPAICRPTPSAASRDWGLRSTTTPASGRLRPWTGRGAM